VDRFLFIQPWTQFFDLKGRQDLPPSLAEHITMTRCDCVCDTYFHVKPDPQRYALADFTFAELQIRARVDGFDPGAIDGVTVRNVTVTTD